MHTAQFDTNYIHTAIANDNRIKPILNRLLYIITYYAKQGKEFSMGNPTLAKKLNVCTKTIKRNLQKLEEWGYITRECVYNKIGHVKLRIIKMGKSLFQSFSEQIGKVEQLKQNEIKEVEEIEEIQQVFATPDTVPERELEVATQPNQNKASEPTPIGDILSPIEEVKNKINSSLFDRLPVDDSENKKRADFRQIVSETPQRTGGHDFNNAYDQYKITLAKYKHPEILAAVIKWKNHVIKNKFGRKHIWKLETLLMPEKLANWVETGKTNPSSRVASPSPTYAHSIQYTAPDQENLIDDPVKRDKIKAQLKLATEEHSRYFRKMIYEDHTDEIIKTLEALTSKMTALQKEYKKFVK